MIHENNWSGFHIFIILLGCVLDKSDEELEYLGKVIDNFRTHVTAVGAVEVTEDMVEYLLQYGKTISTKTTVNLKCQKKLKPRDISFYTVKFS